ncbi:tRNA (guanine(10)-N(2))-dimethyltransferase [Candidatus Woesearchaeota archaeon]|nr:tRNA (guanine(10)-N(2))-dimethyltransferase [Candidatus Woesearchaeota archaeon]
MAFLTEYSTTIEAELPAGDVHAGMEVFYNPVMASNRNISILLLNTIENTQMNVCDPLAGSGIRSLRFLKELNKGKIKQLFVNDMKENFKEVFNAGLKLNKLKPKNLSLFQKDANLFMQEQIGFDYIDIDPFGSPNPFLASAVARISRNGIIAVTATDAAALTGTYPKVTRRKYWAEPLRNYLMHEIGLRILIRKVQLQGIQFDKALVPILSYSKDHYFRAYFRNEKGKEKCDELIKQQQYFLYCNNCLNFKCSIYNKEKCSCEKEFIFAGPLWVGKLSDEKLLEKMVENNPFPEEQKLLELLLGESKVNQVGFYDLHEIARKLKVDPPKMELALKKLKAVRTHFLLTGIKSEKSLAEVIKCVKSHSSV